MVRKREYLNLKKDVLEAQECMHTNRNELASQITELQGEWEQKIADLENKHASRRTNRNNSNATSEQLSPILQARFDAKNNKEKDLETPIYSPLISEKNVRKSPTIKQKEDQRLIA